MLTERRIRDATPQPKTRILWDSQVKGLGVRITPAGAKSYILNYRVEGRERRATLARVSELSLKSARDLASSELGAMRAGDSGPLERRREARKAPTVGHGVERFFEEYAPARVAIGRMSVRTVYEYGKLARRHLLPALGNRKIANVTPIHIELTIQPLPNVQRNRALALTSRLFTLFESWGWRPQHSNPARGIERAREEPRDRVLSPSEVVTLAAALDSANEQHPGPVAAIRFAAVTGLRIGEILDIRWEHVDFETARLLLPSTKTGRRNHDLPSPALDILSGLPRINEWVFTTGRNAAVTYRTVRKVFATVVGQAGLVDVRLHDLRRTVMTRAAMAGVGTYVLRDFLGHKTTAMADRYVRSVGNPVRDAREQVGLEIAALMSGAGPGDVSQRRGG